MFQANLESPIVLLRPPRGSLRPPATSAKLALNLSLLQQELDLFGTKFPSRWTQTFRPFPQHYSGQSPIPGYHNISFIRRIYDLYVGFLRSISHHKMVIRLNVVIETGHRPDWDAVFTSDFQANTPDRFWARICINQNLHAIMPQPK